jgi:hypothetical protein
MLCRAQEPEGHRDDPWAHARGLISQTQADLQQAQSSPVSGKERERYENANRHLSDFDRHLTKQHFDKGKLDDCIGDVQSVLDHNTLSPESRDALRRDVSDLRRLRADYDSWKK